MNWWERAIDNMRKWLFHSVIEQTIFAGNILTYFSCYALHIISSCWRWRRNSNEVKLLLTPEWYLQESSGLLSELKNASQPIRWHLTAPSFAIVHCCRLYPKTHHTDDSQVEEPQLLLLLWINTMLKVWFCFVGVVKQAGDECGTATERFLASGAPSIDAIRVERAVKLLGCFAQNETLI